MSDSRHPVDPERVEAAARSGLTADEARTLGELLDIIGEPVRARILTALRVSEEMCVGDIALALNLNEDTVSYGLRVLRANGLVDREPRGRMAYYRLADGPKRVPLVDALARLRELSERT